MQQQQQQQQQKLSYDDDDEGSIDLNKFTDLHLSSRDHHVPDAVECSFSTSSSSGDSSQSQRSLLEYGDEYEEDSNQQNANKVNKGYLQACGATIKSACKTIATHHAYNFFQQKSRHRKRSKKTKKSVRFADNSDFKTKCTTMKYPREASCADLWIGEEEFEHTCWECYTVTDFYMNNHPKYVAAVLGLAFSYEEKLVTKSEMNSYRNQICISSCARGLETSIAELLLSFRAAHIHAVMAEQDEQRQHGTEFHKTGIESIREVAQNSSRPSRQLARKLAENDTFEAVKATLLPW